MKQIKGVNLGNWLVLEKWMDERFFEGTGAEDEVWLVRKTAPEVLAGKMKQRRFREVSRLQLDAWSVSAGYIYWNYQLNLQTARIVSKNILDAINKINLALADCILFLFAFAYARSFLPGSEGGLP